MEAGITQRTKRSKIIPKIAAAILLTATGVVGIAAPNSVLLNKFQSSKKSRHSVKESAGTTADASVLGIGEPNSLQRSPAVLGIGESPKESGQILGIDRVQGSSQDLPWVDEAASDDPNHITLSIKYVTYRDQKGNPVVSPEAAQKLIAGVNKVYGGCNMHFRVEEYVEAVPADYGLDYSPARMNDLTAIREQFDDPNHVILINTGSWNSSGGLGADGANAWTTMPGTVPSGAVMEESVATHSELVAHEIGHYLNLDHLNDSSNLMNPVIHKGSKLADWQCQEVRNAALTVREEVTR